jgi:hypothetical protein
MLAKIRCCIDLIIMSKRKNTLMHKLVCLSHLMLENLDDLNPTTAKMKKAKFDLITLFEELNNELATSDTLQKTTYFNDISKKIDTIIRKNFDGNM